MGLRKWQNKSLRRAMKKLINEIRFRPEGTEYLSEG